MIEALALGALAASSLVIGAIAGLSWPWPRRAVGLVLGFGAGAMISAVSFELAEDGVEIGGPGSVAVGLTAGALTYYVADGFVERGHGAYRGAMQRRSESSDPGSALALGAFLDGVPEQLVLGIGLAAGEGVSVGLLAAIFVSNLPEAVGSASEMRDQGRRDDTIVRLWILVATVCTLATLAGYGIGDTASGELEGGVNGFAAGALLVMLTDSMIPEARKGGRATGLVSALGFAVAAALSGLS
jgi:zinc transporter, ZIP family